MEQKSERFEMRLEPQMLQKLDSWRTKHGSGSTRSEAARRLMEMGLQQSEGKTMQISDGEKAIIGLIRDLYHGLGVKDGNMDPEFIIEALCDGQDWSIAWKYHGLYGYRQPPEVVNEVSDIMAMWDSLERSYQHLSDVEKQDVSEQARIGSEGISFPGFGENFEIEHLSIAKMLVRNLDHYQSLNGKDLNSHIPCLDGYRRMLMVYEPLKPSLSTGRNLSMVEIIAIRQARHEET